MQEVLQSIEAIQQKINFVQQKIEQQKTEIATLLLDKETLVQQLATMEADKQQSANQIKDLEAQVQVMKLAKSLSDDDDIKKVELKKMISNMIKEVDKCLAVVNVQ
jgi:chromosome segregation ATPase